MPFGEWVTRPFKERRGVCRVTPQTAPPSALGHSLGGRSMAVPLGEDIPWAFDVLNCPLSAAAVVAPAMQICMWAAGGR